MNYSTWDWGNGKFMDIITLYNSSAEEPVIENPEYLVKQPTQLGLQKKEPASFLLWGSAEAGMDAVVSLEILVLYSSWDKLLCHIPLARAYHRAWPQGTQLCTSPGLKLSSQTHPEWWKTQEGTAKNGPCAFPSLRVKYSGFLLPRPHFPEESES